MYSPSKELLDKIKEFEGFRAEPYLDAVGYRTIGYGDLMLPSDHRTHVTEEEASKDLERHVNHIVDQLSALVSLNLLSKSRINALVSLVFNIGIGAFRNSTLHRFISDFKYTEAAEEFLRWNHAAGKVLPGLTERREWEKQQWNLRV